MEGEPRLAPTRRWVLRRRDDAASAALARALSLPAIVAQVLLNRGVGSPADAARFLDPRLPELHEPRLFREMDRAVERVRRAVSAREPILIYGDYDVDGTTAAGLLKRVLALLGADVRCFVPERVADGYGLKAARLAEARESGISLVICVDNGTTAFEALSEARRLGLDVIVTDHHEPAADGRLPEAFALLNPKVDGETYPDRGLAGVGVAFKLAWGVARALAPGADGRVHPRLKDALLQGLALVAIGTVADGVPLTGENRVLVAYGLRVLGQARGREAPPSGVNHWPGIRALLESARVDGRPEADDVAFRLGPRLNAAGRMGKARLGLELLETDCADRAAAIAAILEEKNRSRQSLEREIAKEALERAEAEVARGARALVLADDGERWPLGVVGIVAARLVERFERPAVLISLDGEKGRGSGRSVPGIALHRALDRCREDLLRYGGHAAAAGLEIRRDRVDRFRERLDEAVAAEAGPADVSVDAAAPADSPASAVKGRGGAGGANGASAPGARPRLDIDLEAPFAALTLPVVSQLERLAPHGRGNEAPVFATRGIELVAPPRAMGQASRHLSLLLRHGGAVLRAVGFGLGSRVAALDPFGPRPGPRRPAGEGAGPLAVAYRPFVNRFDGAGRVEIEIRDIASGVEMQVPP